MRESLLLADREGTVLWANPAAERTLGQGPLSLIGLCLGSLLHPADADRALALAPTWTPALLLRLSVLAETDRWQNKYFDGAGLAARDAFFFSS